MPEFLSHSISSAAESTADIAVSLWFDMQPDANATTQVPQWARTLAQAHVDHEVLVLAHPDSAYALSGLVCSVIKAAPWPDDAWLNAMKQAVAQVHAQGTRHIAVMLPNRTTPAVWLQWMLLNQNIIGARLDHTTGLLQGKDGWAQVLQRPDALRWLAIDRVITYGTALTPADYLVHMRAFNPLAQWIHDTQVSLDVLLQALNAYHSSAALSQIALKSDDLSAWNANKVVYFSTSSVMAFAKVMTLLGQWRQKYSHQWVRMCAVIRVQDAHAPIVINSVYHLWTVDVANGVSAQEVPESQFWLLGSHLDAAALRADLLQCGI